MKIWLAPPFTIKKILVKALQYNVPCRYNTMIENAYFYVNPPDAGPDTAKKERPPMHQYIRKLLYNDLSKSNTEKILRQVTAQRGFHLNDIFFL